MDTAAALPAADEHLDEHLRAVLFGRPHGATTEEILAHADLVAAPRELLAVLRRLPAGRRFLSGAQVVRALHGA